MLGESMKVKAEELDKLQVDMQMRTWTREKAGERTAKDREEAKQKSQFGSMAPAAMSEGKRSLLSKGSGFKIVKQLPRGREKAMPGLSVVNADDARATSLLKKLQVNEFFRYVARRPMDRAMELCAEKLAQILGTLRMSEAIAAARARRAQDIMDRLRAELDMLRRKAADQGERLFSEEEAKRAALIKYLHSVMGTSEKNRRRGVDEASAGQARGSAREQEARKKERIDGGTGFLDGSVSVSSSYEDDFEPDDSVVGKEDEEEPVTVRLGQSGIGDEEVHALVAVLTSRDKCDLLDLRGNSVGDVGARGLATVLRDSRVLAEVDLRDNFVTATGLRILAEALEHNSRVRHVFVHGNGRIDALGAVGADEGSGEGTWAGDDGATEDVKIDTVITVQWETRKIRVVGSGPPPRGERRSAELDPLPARSRLSPSKRSGSDGDGEERPKYYTHRQEAQRLDDIDAKRAIEDGHKAMDTPLLRKIRDLEGHLGPAAEHPPESDATAEYNAVLEAEKWSSRAQKQEQTKGLESVPDDWIGTETAPQAYASPLTRRIRALEERLAIADMDDSGAVEPKPAAAIVEDVTRRKAGIRGPQSGGAIGDGGKARRAKSAVGRSRRSGQATGRAGESPAATPMQRRSSGAGLPSPAPSPAWQFSSGPSLLGNALREKEDSINQAATRKANIHRASAARQRAKSATGRSRSSKRAGAARNLKKQREAQEGKARAEAETRRRETKERLQSDRRALRRK